MSIEQNLFVIGKGFTEIKAALERIGCTVLEAAPVPELSGPVAAHADMQLHSFGGGEVIAASGAHELIECLRELGFTVYEQDGIKPVYPRDAALNCFVLGGGLFCNPKSVSGLIVEHYCSTGREVVPVKQGYTKCSACIVSDNALITSDLSIVNAAKARGVDVLVIKSGHILLPGHEYGFIGGASGQIGGGRLAFCGKLEYHPDGDKMREFCELHGASVVELTNSALTDIGGIVALQ